MKISNIFTLLLAGFALAGATSCVDHVEYEPAEPVALAPYYFSTANGDREDLIDGQTSFSILLGRLDPTKEEEVTVEHNSDIDAVLDVPTTVKFAAGEATANLVVSFDLANIEKRKEYKLDLSLAGVENTPYYLGKLNLTVFYSPWVNLGKGIYTDVLLSSIFTNITPVTYQVDVQEHPTIKGYYRLVNPYAPGVYPTKGVDYGTADRFVYINASDPEGVYVETSNTGWCGAAQYGTVVVTSQAYLNMLDGETLEQQKEAELCGTYTESNKNIVIPAEKLLLGMTLYSNGAFLFPNAEEFRLVLPGGKLPSDWDEIGFCNFTDGFAGPFMSTPVLNHTYQVLVEHNKKTGQYRIVDPYAPESGYTSTMPISDNYITFDVSDPKCVTVGKVETPIFNLIKGGRMYATTEADVELETSAITKEELVEAGIGGTFENNVIRIPGEQVQAYYAGKPSNYLYAPTPVDVVLDLNNPTTAQPAAKKKAPLTL